MLVKSAFAPPSARADRRARGPHGIGNRQLARGVNSRFLERRNEALALRAGPGQFTGASR
jgi:hypothetical protein